MPSKAIIDRSDGGRSYELPGRCSNCGTRLNIRYAYGRKATTVPCAICGVFAMQPALPDTERRG